MIKKKKRKKENSLKLFQTHNPIFFILKPLLACPWCFLPLSSRGLSVHDCVPLGLQFCYLRAHVNYFI